MQKSVCGAKERGVAAVRCGAKEREVGAVQGVERGLLERSFRHLLRRKRRLWQQHSLADALSQSFLGPINERNLLDPKDVSAIFSNVEAILPVNEALLKDLQQRQAKNAVIDGIGDIFLKHVRTGPVQR